MLLINHGCNDSLNGASAADVRGAVVACLRGLRAACGPTTHIVLVTPFGGWCASSAPHHALADAFAEYQGSHKSSSTAATADGRTHLLDLRAEAAHNLDGWRVERGRYVPSRESVDGIHPTATRHRELGFAVAREVNALLR